MITRETFTPINWRDNEVTTLTKELADIQTELSDELVKDVGPEDLRIGGLAVHDRLVRAEPYWAVGFVPEASVTLERWATDGDLTVRLKKERNDGLTREYAGLLARQVRGAGNWLPRVSDKRTAKIAQMAGATSLLTVDIFEAPEVMDDETFHAMREAAAENEKGQQGFQKRLHLSNEDLQPINGAEIKALANWSAASRYAWRYIAEARANGMSAEEASYRSWEVQAKAEPTPNELVEEGQKHIDQKLSELVVLATSLRTAVPIVKNGRRLRPTQPQHIVAY